MPATLEHRQRALHHLERQELIAALEPFARLAHDYDLEAHEGDHLIEVPCKHIRAAWVVFAKFAGGENV